MHTQSVLTITSNVVYGKATGNTPDGRRQGRAVRAGRQPDARPRQPRHPRSAASVAKIPYRDAADGISLTTTLVPTGLGRVEADRITNLTAMLDAFFGSTGYHMNVNVLNRDTLLDADGSPGEISVVSPFACRDTRSTSCGSRREQQMDVINRTFHGADAQCLSRDTAVTQTPLEAKSPFELRVDLGKNVPETDVRTALATGDMGFLHSFTTGSTVDGPGVRVVAWTAGCMLRCLYLPQPRHVDDEQRHARSRSRGRRGSCANIGTA